MAIYSFPGAKLVTTRPLRISAPGGLGAVPSPETTLAEYAMGTSIAIAGISQDVKGQIAATNPEVAFSLDALSTVIGAATGQSPGVALASQIAQALGDVLTSVVSGNTSVSTVVQQALGAVEGLSDVIPFVGAIVAIWANALSRPEVTPNEKAILDAKYREYCAGARKSADAPTSGTGALEPADLVSQGDARMRLVECLAGGAARGTLFPGSWITSSHYNSWLNQAKSKYNITGIPLHVQRQIILLMEGIFAARRDPHRAPGTPINGDNGRSLMPILLQILRDQGANEQEGRGKNAYNEASLISLANTFIAPGQQFCTKGEGTKAGLTCVDYPACGETVGAGLYNMIVNWDIAVMEDSAARKAAGDFVVGQPKTSNLVLDSSSTLHLLDSVKQTQEEGKQFFRTTGFGIGQKLLSAAGACGFGYGLYTAVRAFGPRR